MEALPALLSGVVTFAFAFGAAVPQDAAPAKQKPAKSLDEKDFQKSFAALTDLGDAGKWAEEKKALRRLLDDAGDQPWVHAHRTEILDEMKRAAIRAAVPQPDPATLIQGKLVRWDRKSGDLTVTYGPGQWDDFAKVGKFLVHPAVFDEVATVKFDGDKFDWAGEGFLGILVGLHDDELVFVGIGARQEHGGASYSPARTVIVRAVGGKSETLATEPRAPNYGDHYEIEIAIGIREIAVNCNGTRLGSGKLPAGSHGRIGFTSRGPFKHVTLRGRASTAWLQGKMDAATHDAEAKFLEKWKVEDELPPWLSSGATAATPAAPAADAAPRRLPWPTTVAQSRLVEGFDKDLKDGHPEKVLAAVSHLSSSALPADVRDYYQLRANAEMGSLGDEAERLDAFVKRNPDFASGLYFHACLQMESYAFEDAAREFAALRGKYEPADELLERLALVDLLRGKREEAQQVLRDARAAGTSSPKLDALEQVFVHLQRGPNFPRRFEQESQHFALATDLDNDTARASLRVLEESYAISEQVFGRSEGPAVRFPVFLFSGQTGYVEFAGTYSKMAHSTAGMYSPVFKHLLVWNLPDRAEISRTLRHEATHQYLDMLGYHVPVWFNEGLATYVEYIASASPTDVKSGAVNAPMVRGLLEQKRDAIPLARLIHYGPSQFYGRASITYAEAWAFVHFMRHASTFAGGGGSSSGVGGGGGAAASSSAAGAADPAPEEIHRRLIAALKDKATPEEVVRRAFDGVDMNRLQDRFWQHVAAMEASTRGK
jgi:hypothetical protein